MIQRYDVNSCSDDCDPVTPMKDGNYILYADHLEVVAEKDKEIIALKKEMQRREDYIEGCLV